MHIEVKAMPRLQVFHCAGSLPGTLVVLAQENIVVGELLERLVEGPAKFNHGAAVIHLLDNLVRILLHSRVLSCEKILVDVWQVGIGDDEVCCQLLASGQPHATDFVAALLLPGSTIHDDSFHFSPCANLSSLGLSQLLESISHLGETTHRIPNTVRQLGGSQQTENSRRGRGPQADVEIVVGEQRLDFVALEVGGQLSQLRCQQSDWTHVPRKRANPAGV
mmetsp:Transcript_90799/g.189826  ORF Transcript_90799/g.189826 Transcript_90799/m.189826 type:complete len:221 (-) Transcript_90799:457-1119(-)